MCLELSTLRRLPGMFTRNGYDWSDRYPIITKAALRNRNTSFVIDGEAVLLGVDGISDFNGLHSRKRDEKVQFYAFDCLVSDGEEVRKLPLSMRKANLSRLLARRGGPTHSASISLHGQPAMRSRWSPARAPARRR